MPASARPAGCRSGLQQTWDTLDLLAAEGVEYVADWCNDDQPYEMNLDDGRSIIAMPYTQQLNDKSAIERRFVSADGFRQMICDSFDVLYKEGAKSGRVMAIALHPYLIGVPHRIGGLRQGAEIHQQAQEGLEDDRLRDRATLSRAVEGRRIG